MSRPHHYNHHAELIKEYIHKMGLFGVTQEIYFVLNEMKDRKEVAEAIKALEKFQAELTAIQNHRIHTIKGPVEPIGVKDLHQSQTDANGMKNVFGKWPGDETDAEIQDGLKD